MLLASYSLERYMDKRREDWITFFWQENAVLERAFDHKSLQIHINTYWSHFHVGCYFFPSRGPCIQQLTEGRNSAGRAFYQRQLCSVSFAEYIPTFCQLLKLEAQNKRDQESFQPCISSQCPCITSAYIYCIPKIHLATSEIIRKAVVGEIQIQL